MSGSCTLFYMNRTVHLIYSLLHRLHFTLLATISPGGDNSDTIILDEAFISKKSELFYRYLTFSLILTT